MKILENLNEVKYPYSQYPYAVHFKSKDRAEKITTAILTTLNLLSTKCWAMQIKDLSNNGRTFKITFATLEEVNKFIQDVKSVEKEYKLEDLDETNF